MKISNLPGGQQRDVLLNDLVFTGINDTPDNPRLGLGYHQLYDPTVPVTLIAKLPNVTRPGDTITLYWDGVEEDTYDLDLSIIERGWLSFSVKTDRIKAPSGTAYYTLFDHRADDLQTSNSRTINVNRLPPGGLDPDTNTAINEGMAPATIAPSIISDASTPVTVTVPPWINMEAGDELTVLWNSIRVPHPPIGTVNVAQDVVIPQAVLEQGGSNAKLPVTYDIRDIVDNYSLMSPTAFADVDIDPDAVAAPRVTEANPTTLILDLKALGDKDAHVQIPRYAGIATGDRITLTWVGRSANAETTLVLAPKDVTGDPDFDPPPVFDIPNAHLQSIAGGSAMASYDVAKVGGAKHSKRTAITLTGLPVALADPVLREATGTVIDLTQLTGDLVHVAVAPWFGKKEGDLISLVWTGTPANGAPVHYVDDHNVIKGEENAEYVFNVGRINLDPLLGGSLSLKYQVTFADTTSPVDSGALTYTVVGENSITDDFSGQPFHLMVAGESITTALLNIRFESGGIGQAGFPDRDSVPADGSPSLALPMFHVCFQAPLAPASQSILIDLGRGCRAVACDIYGCNGGTTVALLNTGQVNLANITIPVATNQYFTSPVTAEPIRFMRIISNKDWTIWDNFKLTI